MKTIIFLILSVLNINVAYAQIKAQLYCEGLMHNPEDAENPRTEVFSIILFDDDTATVKFYKKWQYEDKEYTSDSLPGFDNGEVMSLVKDSDEEMVFQYNNVSGHLLTKQGFIAKLVLSPKDMSAVLSRKFIRPFLAEPPTYEELDQMTGCKEVP